ncbi:MAG: FliG C-terminal domain-containing protein [Elusimicrobiota bacterium]
MKFICKLFFALTLLAGVTVQTFADTQERITIEYDIRSRTERVIEKILGSRDFVVIVEVVLERQALTDQRPTTRTQTTTITPQQQQQQQQQQDKGFIIFDDIIEPYPGFSTPRRREQQQQAAAQQQQAVTQQEPIQLVVPQLASTIKKVSVFIMLDIAIKDSVVENIKREVADSIGYDQARGDVLGVKKVAFARKTWGQNFAEFFSPNNPNMYWILLALFVLGVITFFLFGPLQMFFKTIVKAAEIRIEADTRIRSSGKMDIGGQLGGLGLEEGEGGGAGALPRGMTGELTMKQGPLELGPGRAFTVSNHFTFINAGNLKNLLYLLQQETAEAVAVVMNYLPPAFASQIFGALSTEKQAKVAIELSTVKLKSPDEVEEIERDIKTKIDYLMGGEDYFMDLLDQVDPKAQESILNLLSREKPELAEKLRRVIFVFEDIAFLEKAGLQKVLRESQRQGVVLALALKTADESIKASVMDCLSEGARAMLAEQIDLIGEVNPRRIEEEQRKIARIVRSLEKSGELVIRRDGAEDTGGPQRQVVDSEPVDQ